MLPSALRGGVDIAAGLDASDIADVLQGGWPAARYCSVSAQGAAPGSCVPRRGAAAACTAMVTHPAWCYRLATPKPSGGPKRGRGAAHADVPSWPRPATPARRRACSSLCRSCCARTSSQHCACRVSAAAVRFTPGSRWPSALLTVVPAVPVPGCVREDGGVSKPCEGAVFHQAVEQDGGVVGEAHPRRAPLAFAVYSDKTTKPQCVQRVQCPVPTLCGLIAAAGTSRMQKPHRWQGMARVRAA